MKKRIALGGRLLAATLAAAVTIPAAGVGVSSAADNDQIAIQAVTVPAGVNTFNAVGQVLTFNITASNIGVFDMTQAYIEARRGGNPFAGVTFSNPPGGTCYTASNKLPTFAQATSFDCRASYTITQADLDRGSLAITFWTWGTAPNSEPMGASVQPNLTAVQTPAITLTKKATKGDPFAKPGDVIDYELVATNTGNVTLTKVQIDDPMLGGVLPSAACDPKPEAPPSTRGVVLAPGGKLTCTGSYAVTQADVDADVVDNTATTKGTPPTGNDVTAQAIESVPGTPNPAIDLVKQANPQKYTQVGEVITYTLVATNTGNMTLSNVVVSDPKLSNLVCDPVTPATLAPGAKTTCTGKYSIVLEDVQTGQVKNTATVTGQPPGGRPPVTDEDTAIVTGPTADMAITKSHTPASVSIGLDVTFTLGVKNNGPGTSYGVKVTDTLPAELQYVSAGGPDWTCSHSAQIITCDYGKPFPSGASSQITVVTKAVSAGSQIVNVAVVDAKTPDPDPSNNRAEDVVGVTKDVHVCPTDITIKPGVAVIPGCRDVQIRVLCKVKKPSAAGQISYCRVKQRKNGSVRVISKSQYPVKVKVVWFAPATDEYQAFRKVKRFTLKPNLPRN